LLRFAQRWLESTTEKIAVSQNANRLRARQLK
jgi:hypothetical protein